MDQGTRWWWPAQKNGLAMVYNLGQNTDYFRLGTGTARIIRSSSSATRCRSPAANQQWQWKGEWWCYDRHHDLLAHPDAQPDVLRLPRHQSVDDCRGTITLIAASSNHPGGVNVLFMDGSVRFVKSTVNYVTWYAIATPDGGEVVSSDSY